MAERTPAPPFPSDYRNHMMKFGLGLCMQQLQGEDMTVRFQELVQQVRLAKQLGFVSVSASQHYLSAPDQYIQPIPTLSRLVDETDGMALILGVVVLPLQHPLSLAEDVATLDVISGGRVVMGVALGYRDEENEAFNLNPRKRVSRFEESLEIVKQLWEGDPVTFEGQHFQMKDVQISCRPAQRPRPRIAIGASIEKGIRRAARIGDSWVCAPHATIETVKSQQAFYYECLDEFGKRRPRGANLARECYVAPTYREAIRGGHKYISGKYKSYHEWGQDDAMPDDETFVLEAEELARDRFVVGDPKAVIDEIQRYKEELGLTSMGFRVQWPGMANAEVLRTIRLLGEEVLPHV
ncbi:MAG: LLM class flavin-dependent oxidoreductase [Gammaproteobacteria bacterium]|nr:LLM class flavin-dependent oxidoreductase [Gammaproteobacteria bacterium]